MPDSCALSHAAPLPPVEDLRASRVVLPLQWATRLLNDPRDAIFVQLILVCAALSAFGVSLFFVQRAFWYLVPLYWLLVWVLVFDRFILMLHCTSHRALFAPRFRRLNLVIPWLIGPFMGQTPGTYFVHHLGMHHRAGNLPDDASSTMKYRRDRLDHWLRYLARFLFVGVFDLLGYLLRHRRRQLVVRLIRGEVLFWIAMAILMVLNARAALAVFIGPLLLVRVLMMAGNWGQHAFVCQLDAGNPYRNSITCINTRYNRRCFNDGYHINHHVEPRRHWTEYPGELEANWARYGEQDAIVFRGLDFFGVWLCLMLRRWKTLARAFVHLPGAPLRTDAEVIALLQQRVRPCATAR